MKSFFQTWGHFIKRKFWVSIAIIMILDAVQLVTRRAYMNEAVAKHGLPETIVLLIASIFINGMVLAILVGLVWAIVDKFKKLKKKS
ncbi:hypothetical protein P59_161 [Bacillus phage P59]|nr:hypothetical protein P59_161 [Bacillus phage P59]